MFEINLYLRHYYIQNVIINRDISLESRFYKTK